MTLWVNFCRASSRDARPLYPRKLPRCCYQSGHAAPENRVKARVVDERIQRITQRRKICGPLDRDRDVIGHHEHKKHGHADLNYFAYRAHSRQYSHSENLLGQFFGAIVSLRQP